MLIDILSRQLSNWRSPIATHLVVVDVVLVESAYLVVLLHLLALVGATGLQSIQQLALDDAEA